MITGFVYKDVVGRCFFLSI